MCMYISIYICIYINIYIYVYIYIYICIYIYIYIYIYIHISGQVSLYLLSLLPQMKHLLPSMNLEIHEFRDSYITSLAPSI